MVKSRLVILATYLFVLHVVKNHMLPATARNWQSGMKSVRMNPRQPIGFWQIQSHVLNAVPELKRIRGATI
jgi:hypothetical protein